MGRPGGERAGLFFLAAWTTSLVALLAVPGLSPHHPGLFPICLFLCPARKGNSSWSTAQRGLSYNGEMPPQGRGLRHALCPLLPLSLGLSLASEDPSPWPHCPRADPVVPLPPPDMYPHSPTAPTPAQLHPPTSSLTT